ncbi:putative cytoplasmic l-asparaginase i-like protein [Trypanosoma grayi]|uniref:putative cytoplasmic l-asparaginase i-like protein n=1 Tax=Trypanosoma grayi TaxID=71804 RepID=UPI0004F4BD4D|nr:putative cytoplasmic l-asparaginase i-like protein [Trypanosoma grayi]KEG07618.1 putative cytoplasmic l-asparaginase i-like protein [Trypanosoma grayi]
MTRSSAESVPQSPILFVSYNESGENSRADDLFPHRDRRVLILYVGGTIGMKRTPSGALKPRKGYLTQVVRAMGELQQRPEIAPFDVVEYDELLDSSDMDGRDYLRIAHDVAHHYDDYDGFLVLHGTDTMHYTASALSFLLMNLAKPVVLTGSMVPLVEPYSDARRNLVISLMLASNPAIREVCVFFNDSLLRGNCCCKMHHTFGAFCSPNYPALGVVEPTGFELREHLLISQPGGPLKVQSNMSGRVMVFTLYADYDMKVLTQLLLESSQDAIHAKDSLSAAGKSSKSESAPDASAVPPPRGRPLMDAVVLEITGVSELKGDYSASLRELARVAEERDIVACVTVREPFGSLSAEEQRRLRLVSPYLIYLRMTTATVEVKLMYLFGKGLSPAAVRNIMPRNLRGEITPGTSFVANL